MPSGTIKDVVHLAQQTPVANARLVRDHNDVGYGHIAADDQREVYFAYDAVDGCSFEELWQGQEVQYELQAGSEKRAKRVTPVRADAEPGRDGVKNPPPPEEKP